MKRAKRPPYRPEDYIPLPIDELSCRARVSRAFIRLCIVEGCPAPKSRLSEAKLITWLNTHYDKVRLAAGLRPLADISGVAPHARGELRLANTILTLLEYAESRSTKPAEKTELRGMIALIEKAI